MQPIMVLDQDVMQGTNEKVKIDAQLMSGHVLLSGGSIATFYLDDVINHCRSNQLQTQVKSLNAIRGCIINRSLARALDLIEKIDVSSAFMCAVKLQLTAFFKKNESIPKSSNIDEVTTAAFFSAEESCMRQNILESYFSLNPNEDPHNLNVMRIRNRISSVLGPFSNFEKRLSSLVRFSQGASALHTRPYSADYRKIFRSNEMSEECAVVARYVYQDVPAVLRCLGYGAQEYNYSRVITVPKNYKTKRTIAAEPTGHNPWQLAFDSYCKERLQRYGIDLMDQHPNQQLAFEGSCSGRYATIDLKQASDTIAYEVVKLLFPEDWFLYLDSVRTPLGLFNGETIKFEKFSSMGNGTTFCIETLIFEAIAFVASRQSYDRLVYGDDIIVRTEFAHDTIELLKRFGFQTNPDKTHLVGPYRESCGEHYWDGTQVTPINLLRDLYRIDDFYDLLNRWLMKTVDEVYEGCTFRSLIGYFQKVCRTYDIQSKRISSSLGVQYVPPGSPATSGIRSPAVSNSSTRLWRVTTRDGIPYYRAIVSVAKISRNKRLGRYLSWLFRYSGYSGEQRPYLEMRDGRFLVNEPVERVTSSSADTVFNITHLRTKLLACSWQVLHSPDRFHLLDVDWDAFRSPQSLPRKRRS